ncbi:MAG: hypothetical protein HN704_02285 [Bacteroidetes bacterium]|nr:hypothetical protein [Bacteroidota bacterium]MBT6687354.1 hypothetical protein [Bacteroidota bacterium]MBT7144612.1 hypothetical protein [Bacteroidota bacterium]MBT7490414.1 hypothetical protein [Bacteroidota bacterium]
MKLYIKKGTNYYHPILYTLKIVEKNQDITFQFIDIPEEADMIWDHSHSKTQVIACEFYDELVKDSPDLSHSNILKNKQIIFDKNRKKDLLATTFYMINCLQEFSPKESDLDNHGRFLLHSCYQEKYNCIEINLVQHYIDQIIDSFGMKNALRKSSFFVSHDIDTIYGSFVQDGFWAIKKMRLDVILTLIFNEILRKPHWKNIDKIIKIDSEYDIRSTFFWLVTKSNRNSNIKNADYSIEKEQKLLNQVNANGFINGLHKSCDKLSINEEIEKGNLNTTFNRYHFLNFLPHRDWKKLSDSIVNFDASLGFAERYGFRNSYGNAFQPFNISEMKPYNFIIAPLNFMDGTFHRYMKIDTNRIGNIIIDFFEKNKYNCLFSLLWHNTYFTNYKYNSFIKEYKKTLLYIYENKIECVTPQEIINKNKLIW